MSPSILDSADFRRVRAHDLKDIPDEFANSLIDWKAGMEHRGVGRNYTTASDLLKYYDVWDIWETLPRYLNLDKNLIADSAAVTKNVYATLERPENHRSFTEETLPVDFLNAEDYIFQNAYQLPERRRPRRILDFGAGMGRQVNIWSQKVDDLVYCAMEAIEMGYIAQNYYYNHIPNLTQHEYILNPDGFKISEEKGIYHLPTWRWDLLPENFFDLVIGVQVLPELDETLAQHMFKLFEKIITPGGALYIRDHGIDSFYQHEVDYEACLQDNGFVLEFKPYIVDRKDVHGLPRIWRKTYP